MVITDKWAKLILAGKKTVEVKSKPNKYALRSTIGIAISGTNRIWGEAFVEDEVFLTRQQARSKQWTEKHCVDKASLDAYSTAAGDVYAYVLTNVIAYPTGIQYTLEQGTVNWVLLQKNAGFKRSLDEIDSNAPVAMKQQTLEECLARKAKSSGSSALKRPASAAQAAVLTVSDEEPAQHALDDADDADPAWMSGTRSRMKKPTSYSWFDRDMIKDIVDVCVTSGMHPYDILTKLYEMKFSERSIRSAIGCASKNFTLFMKKHSIQAAEAHAPKAKKQRSIASKEEQSIGAGGLHDAQSGASSSKDIHVPIGNDAMVQYKCCGKVFSEDDYVNAAGICLNCNKLIEMVPLE